MPDELPGPYSIGSDLWPGLSRVAEEAGEVVQVIGKVIGGYGQNSHYDGSDLREHMWIELADLLAAIGYVIDKNGLDWALINERRQDKRSRYEQWHTEGVAARALTGTESTDG